MEGPERGRAAGAVEDIGLLGLVLLLEEQGRTTAQVPLAATCVYGLLAVAAHGTPEQRERLLPPLRSGAEVAAGAFTHGGAAPPVRAAPVPGRSRGRPVPGAAHRPG